jgi:3-methyladenine DNA glycosylase Mpg
MHDRVTVDSGVRIGIRRKNDKKLRFKRDGMILFLYYHDGAFCSRYRV